LQANVQDMLVGDEHMNDCCFSFHVGYWCERCFGEVNICMFVWLVGWANK